MYGRERTQFQDLAANEFRCIRGRKVDFKSSEVRAVCKTGMRAMGDPRLRNSHCLSHRRYHRRHERHGRCSRK